MNIHYLSVHLQLLNIKNLIVGNIIGVIKILVMLLLFVMMQ